MLSASNAEELARRLTGVLEGGEGTSTGRWPNKRAPV